MGKTIFKILRNLSDELLDLIYPREEKCIICQVDGFVGICDYCRSKIKNMNLYNKEVISYGFYGGILKKLILEFKYNKNFIAGEVLSEFIFEMINKNKIKPDIICYVPMTKNAIKKRGFNQCKFIATRVGYLLDVPISNCILKVRNTKEQKTLSKDERRINVEGAFKIKNNKDVFNKEVILIDDVITTGSTVNECKKILKINGTKRIIILTIAKSDI